MDNQNQSNTVPIYTTPAPPPPSFPPISQLFKDSWQTFTKSLLQLFLLNVAGILIYLVLVVLAVLIFIIFSGVGSLLLKNGLEGIATNLPLVFLNPGFPRLIIIAFFIASVFGLIFLIVGSALSIASIVIVDSQGQIPLGDALRKSFGLIIPLLLVNILTFVLTFGALFVFILPVLLFYFLLVFVQFEVILSGQRWTEALRKSVLLVSRHFGAILVRFIIYVLIYLGIVITTNLLNKIIPDVLMLNSILPFIINLLFGWFVLAYITTLYKQARVGLEQEPGKGIWWMWIIAVIGWLIAAGVIFAGWKMVSSGFGLKNLTQPIPTIQQNPSYTTPIDPFDYAQGQY